MAAPTDVLRVFNRYGAHLPSDHADAVAAVAELMDAAQQGLDSIPRPTGRNGKRSSYNTVRAARERLTAAVARCKGEI